MKPSVNPRFKLSNNAPNSHSKSVGELGHNAQYNLNVLEPRHCLKGFQCYFEYDYLILMIIARACIGVAF